MSKTAFGPNPHGVVRQASLRASNLSLVAKRVFASPKPVARVDVATATGLTRSTVSRLVDELVAARIVREADPVFSRRRGRPAVPLLPGSGHHVALGLEANVTSMSVRLVDLSGAVLDQIDVSGEYASSEPKRVLAELAQLGRQALDGLDGEACVIGVHLAVPGLVDSAAKTLLWAPNLRWRDVRPQPLLVAAGLTEAELGFGLSNEADCAAVCVAQSAPGRPSLLRDFLFVSGGVGVGSALVLNGEVTLGTSGWAGEIGHLCVDQNGPRCACGATGCLERYAGARAILTRAAQPDFESLRQALADGDRLAAEAVEWAGRALGVAISGALNLLDVSTVVLGGGLAPLAESLRRPILEQLSVRVLAAPFASHQVIAAPMERSAPALGAAYRTLGEVLADPAAWMPDQDARSRARLEAGSGAAASPQTASDTLARAGS